ncbi:dUTP diphosphatase [Bacillus pumilus]|uniref:dUTP diphosphatase n=1 Tax=Bacillus pumilus TaxID=1408 RepID=UPI0011A7BB8E|nr:dUTP diphosphatase [Bacillus pumilus]
MNLQKMFEMQAELDRRIIKEKGLEGQDLLPGLILALQVELAECANEWRGFKFWSNDQQPCTEKEIECSLCKGTGDMNYERIAEDAEGSGGHEYIKCEECNGEGTTGTKNPLLEEYVDCLHFILSIGNLTKYSKNNDVNDLKRNTLEVSGVKAFLELFKEITFFNEERKVSKNTIGLTRIMIYERIFWRFNELGIALGFTPDQIEKAYMDKNAVNHKRQQEGY